MNRIKKQLEVEVKAVKGRVISFLASPNTKDRDNEIIEPTGWVLDNYKKNPVFLWQHNRYEPPIGKAINVYIDNNGLNIDVEFADAQTYEFADTIFKLYQGGYLNAVSVGFMVLERDPNDTYRITKQELFELSGVTVPANQDALAKALNEKVIDEKCYNGICEIDEKDLRLEKLEKKIKENEIRLENIISKLSKADADESLKVSQAKDTVEEIIKLIKNKQ